MNQAARKVTELDAPRSVVERYRREVLGARLLVCSSARLLACSPARLLACSSARLLACSPARLLACSPARLLACSPARLLIRGSLATARRARRTGISRLSLICRSMTVNGATRTALVGRSKVIE